MNEIRLVCFDMDETLIDKNSSYELNLALGITAEEDYLMYSAYKAGELSYLEWNNKIASLFKTRGLANRNNILESLNNYTFKDGAVELVESLKEKGYELVIISGSYDLIVDQVADTLGIVHRQANYYLKFDDNNYLEEVISESDEFHSKLYQLEMLCERLEISIEQCVCIGDGANEIELFKKTKQGITFTDAPEHVKEVAWRVVRNLSEINSLL